MQKPFLGLILETLAETGSTSELSSNWSVPPGLGFRFIFPPCFRARSSPPGGG